MPKPKWLSDLENGVERPERPHTMCSDCSHYGPVMGVARHKGKEKVDVHECLVNPGCLNTKYSICCDDWEPIN